jgi:cytochrome c-type biogenesis protein CcmH
LNITYWVVISVFFAIVFIIILPPLLKKRKTVEAEADSDQRNINIAQERLNDLEQQLARGVLTQNQFDEQYGELELTLGDDLAIEQTDKISSSAGRWVAPVILVCVPVFSVLTYFSLGEPDALKKAEIKQSQHASEQGQDINSMVMALAQRLKDNPNNAEDWVMLGRSFKYLKQYKLAANSFEKAYGLLGEDPNVMLQYADSLAMINGGKIVGKASELVFKALEKAPNDVTGLWLAGMAKAEIGQFPEAIEYWRKLESILPPESDSYKEVQNLISQVQTQISGTPLVEKTEKKIPEKVTVSVSVQVSIASSISSKISQNDTVFIYAKALTGPPMPLAIVRKKVSDLPLSVTLDDSMAMMPTMKLSNFDAVKIMARVSKSGTAMQQKGDFIGTVELNSLTGNTTVAIVINKEI